MTDLYISDTILYVGYGRAPRYKTSLKEKMRREKPQGKNGEVTIKKVTSEEMQRMWK